MTILDLISLAYRVRHYQVSGGPSWLSTRRFDVQAQPGSNVSEDDGRRMLQTLLADRFDLAIHRVSRRVRGYSMHLPKGPGKLRMSTTPETDSGFATMSTREMRGESVSMRTLAHALTEILGSPVEDRTGAASRYRTAFQWTPDELSAAGEPGPSVFSVLWEELGVKLKPDRVEVEGIVVDHVRENPTEN